MSWRDWILKTFTVVGCPATVLLVFYGAVQCWHLGICVWTGKDCPAALRNGDQVEAAMSTLLEDYPDMDVKLVPKKGK